MGFTTLRLNQFWPVRLPASEFPARADTDFCDLCDRDITRKLRPRRSHSWQPMGPARYICHCGQSWPAGAAEWDHLSKWERQRRLRQTFFFVVAASAVSSILAVLVYFLGAGRLAVVIAALPLTLLWVPYLCTILFSLWRTRVRRAGPCTR